jgi:hypothetical protein
MPKLVRPLNDVDLTAFQTRIASYKTNLFGALTLLRSREVDKDSLALLTGHLVSNDSEDFTVETRVDEHFSLRHPNTPLLIRFGSPQLAARAPRFVSRAVGLVRLANHGDVTSELRPKNRLNSFLLFGK